MANDRKLLTADALNLKARVKAEMLRRSYSGSVAAYGGTAYDFSTKPVNDGPVLGEHLKKNLEPMRAVNGDGLPAYPGPLTKSGQEAMETKIAAWKTRSLTDRSASDCKSGCTGTCYSGCQTGCYTTCTSCTGCTGTCTGSCQGCSGTCTGGCTNSCSGCGGSCSNDCSGCGSGCSGDCDGGCRGCGSGCSGSCDGCTGNCTGDCLNTSV